MWQDLGLMVAFFGLVMAPVLMAMKTGLHRDEEYETIEFRGR